MNSTAEKPSYPSILINQNEKNLSSGHFVQIPRFWIDDYFDPACILQGITNKNGSARKAQRVPASFWKYTLHLWRYVSVPRNGAYRTDIAIDQFPVRPDAAVMWTAAYAMSGVMKLEMGRWTKEHNDCTVFAYDPQTPHAAWRCFLTALDYAYNQVQDYKRGSDAKIGSNVGAWKVVVALAVDDARNRAGLPLVNQAFLEAAAAGKEMDVRGRIIAKRDGKGNVEPVFWHATRRR